MASCRSPTDTTRSQTFTPPTSPPLTLSDYLKRHRRDRPICEDDICLSDWLCFEAILAAHYPPAATGRPRADPRRVLNGVIFRMRSGCQWNHLPKCFGDDSTVHRWFQRWTKDGVLKELWARMLIECEDIGGVDWRWQAADGCMNKSRFDGDKRGANPTDRAKPGTKKSLIVERSGGPLGLEIAGANVHDKKLLEATIEAIVVDRPDPQVHPQHLLLDKGYDRSRNVQAVTDGGCPARRGFSAAVSV